MTERWQHVRPKSLDECGADPVRPAKRSSRKPVCAACGARIHRVDADEGPESLKALLRF